MNVRAGLVTVLVRCSLALILGAAANSCLAGPVGEEEACAVANGWHALRFQNEDVRETFAGEPPAGFDAGDARPIVVNGWVIAYAFDTASGGCIAIPADDSFPPILFYSLENSLAVPAVPPAQAILESFAGQIARVQTDAVSLSLSRDPLWDKLAAIGSGGVELPTSDSFRTAAVGPLLTSKWDQIEPYNDKCPMLDTDRCLVGCVATAMAQVMRYWKHPANGTGSHCYFWSLGGETLCADFGVTTYDWANMPDKLTTSSPQAAKDTVSTLCSHCGISVEMMYGPEWYGGSWAYYEDVGPALLDHFGYATTRYELRDDYTLAGWYELMCGQIDAGQPVLLGHATLSHALVLDGYDSPLLVHLNMGWGGVEDGWYSIGASSQEYTDAVLDIRPNAPTIALSRTSLSNTCNQGTNAPAQSFDIWNSGAGTLTYSIADDAAWLNCAPASGSSTGEHATIQVNYTTSALSVGDHSARITVTASGAVNSPKTIDVFLSVKEPTSMIGLSPPSLTNECDRGEDAPLQTFQLWNSGVGTLNYSITDDVTWLSCRPTAGQSTGEHDTIEVVYVTSGLAAGTHTATITVTAAGAGNTPVTIPVELTVHRPYTVWHVDDSVASSGDGTSWATAFKTIQAGLDAANSGEIVLVAEGNYGEKIHFHGKNVILKSTNIYDPGVVGNTIIDGAGSGPVVSFSGTEDESCLLAGFTIRNGVAVNGGGICGGTAGANARAAIQNNVLESNSAQYGGAISWCDGKIENNVIRTNSAARFGGGLFDCDGAVRSNLVAQNTAQKSGGGASNCDGAMENNTFVANSAVEDWAGGLYQCKGTITNCIFWGNLAKDNSQLTNSTAPTYSCIQGWTGGGDGNITGDPLFVGASDYRLSAASPSIDKGSNMSWMAGAMDLDYKPRILQGASSLTVDMGAYEYGACPLEITAVAETALGAVQLTWRTRPGQTYAVHACTNLCGGSWSELATISSEGSEASWTDTSPGQRVKFYRVEMK